MNVQIIFLSSKNRQEFIRKCVKMTVAAMGIWGTLITYGLFQERIIRRPYEFCFENQTSPGQTVCEQGKFPK